MKGAMSSADSTITSKLDGHSLQMLHCANLMDLVNVENRLLDHLNSIGMSFLHADSLTSLIHNKAPYEFF